MHAKLHFVDKPKTENCQPKRKYSKMVGGVGGSGWQSSVGGDGLSANSRPLPPPRKCVCVCVCVCVRANKNVKFNGYGRH